jgi:hypothetical protein
MSTVAFPREAAQRRPARGYLAAAIERLGPDAILGVVLLAFASVLWFKLPSEFSVDTWLALVTGREVWQSGIPHHVVLTALPLGKPWIDQQWLSQLASYAIYRVGGLGLLGLVGALGLGGGVAAAAVAARRLGASMLSVLVILPLAMVLVFPSREIRTQDFAIPLFVAVAYLVAADVRRPSRRVFWCLPLLVLWANLHGSVTLGAGLVGLHGVTLAWERRRELKASARAWGRPVALVAGAALSILITPYGLSIVSYYRSTMLGSSLRNVVTEWQPITASPVLAAVLAVVAALAVWGLWRKSSRTTPWERLSLLVLAVGSIDVQRNVLFFGLFALMVVPVWLGLRHGTGAPLPDGRRVLINGTLIGLALTVAVIAAASALTRPASTLQYGYQRPGVLTAVKRALRANPSLRIFGEVRFDDWLLWRDPALHGRIAFDSSFELLTPTQLSQLQNVFSGYGRNWKQVARGYRLLVLDRSYEPRAVLGFLAEPGRRILYDDGERLVILRTASQAAKA